MVYDIKYKEILLYDTKVSAGSGTYLPDSFLSSENISIPNTKEYKTFDYAVKVSGDSMLPKYSDGDILLVQKTDCLDIGDIGIFVMFDEVYVKKLGEYELISLNPKYSNIPLTEDTFCIGRVVSKYKK